MNSSSNNLLTNGLNNELSVLPESTKAKLYDLFGQIEKEFELVYLENLCLKNKLETQQSNGSSLVATGISTITGTTPTFNLNDSMRSTNALELGENSSDKILSPNFNIVAHNQQKSQKTKTNSLLQFPKFRPPRDLMQTLRNSTQIAHLQKSVHVDTKLIQSLNGHKDGIWDVCVSKLPSNYIENLFKLNNFETNNQTTLNYLIAGTASADFSARLWLLNKNITALNHSIQNGLCIQQYCGHQGSVNSIRFHPNKQVNLVLSASGDGQAHIWQSILSDSNSKFESNHELLSDLHNYLTSQNLNQNNNGNTNSIQNQNTQSHGETGTLSLIRTPISRYDKHSDVCIAADWFPDGDYLATASWDRTSNVYNVETGQLVCSLQHDDQLTNVTLHNTQKILLTSSKDTTFKIWDFRNPSENTVNIYQAHNRAVNSAIFVNDDKLATTSDDHTCKIWDLRVMRSPVCSIGLNASVNRLCTSINTLNNEVILCLPLDNRDIKFYSLNGERLHRFPRTNRIGHKRLVTSVASCDDYILSASFDKQVLCWSSDFKQPTSNLSQFMSQNLKKMKSISDQPFNSLATTSVTGAVGSYDDTNDVQQSTIATSTSHNDHLVAKKLTKRVNDMKLRDD